MRVGVLLRVAGTMRRELLRGSYMQADFAIAGYTGSTSMLLSAFVPQQHRR